jgi:dihydrofolate reductase
MIVSAIAAIDRAGLIGDGTKMPWHLPRDLKRFRALTWGKPIVMGRRTFESIGGPLEGRLNIVLSRGSSVVAERYRIARSVADALEIAKGHLKLTQGDEAFIIGGASVFAETLPLWDRLYLTVVEGPFQGNTFFPLDCLRESRWREVREDFFEADARNRHAHWFLSLERQREHGSCDQDFDVVSWLNHV